jgi:hypothetical protein
MIAITPGLGGSTRSDKDQTDDPMEFCSDLSQRVYLDRNLPITRRTSPEEEERIQQAT